MKNEHDNTAMRLDKWLWAARFFKTARWLKNISNWAGFRSTAPKSKQQKHQRRRHHRPDAQFTALQSQSIGTQPPAPPRPRSASALRRRHENRRRTRSAKTARPSKPHQRGISRRQADQTRPPPTRPHEARQLVGFYKFRFNRDAQQNGYI